MSFNSVSFLVFFPLVTCFYFILPHRFRWIFLLAASCVFYMAFIPAYILVLAFIILLDYVAAIKIEASQGTTRRVFLLSSIVANVGLLAVFKYWNFSYENLSAALRLFGISIPECAFSLLLPLGLSFHTFQAMSYTIEVYRGRQPAERHLGIYALYVMFYPQLVSGPIERPGNLLPQFREEHSYDPKRVWEGVCLMLWGFFKKIVVADRLAVIADSIFDHPQAKGLAVLIGVYAFAYQIYCDFSGYTDIARGAAKVMGFHLMENFDFPYSAGSIADFWRKWHISLSSWLRDYIYLPLTLSGEQLNAVRNSLYLMIVFLICGLWHGARWTFVLWGFLHGAAIVAYLAAKPWLDRLKIARWRGLNAWFTFHFVAMAWIFFRAYNVELAIQTFQRLCRGWSISSRIFSESVFGLNRAELWIAATSVIVLEAIQWKSMQRPWIPLLSGKSPYVQAAVIESRIINGYPFDNSLFYGACDPMEPLNS